MFNKRPDVVCKRPRRACLAILINIYTSIRMYTGEHTRRWPLGIRKMVINYSKYDMLSLKYANTRREINARVT